MAELDYQRGLRGGSNLNYSGQQYDDWWAGYKEYERIQKDKDFKEDLDMDKFFSTEEQNARHKKRQSELDFEIAQNENRYRESVRRDKEAAYKSADSNRSIGLHLLFSVMGFVVVLVVGYIIVGILALFKVFLPTIWVWLLAFIPGILIFWEGNNRYKKEVDEAERRYGKRN